MNRRIIKINIIVFLYSLAAYFVHPVTPAFIKSLGLHDYMFGLAFGMMSLANFMFSPFWGKMAERFGPNRILSVGFIGYGVMQFVFGLATEEWHIAFARFFGGLFISAISVSEIVYVMNNSENSGRDLAVLTMINSVTGQFGFLIGGFMGVRSLKLPFFVQAVTLASIGVLIIFLLRDGEESESRAARLSLKEINPFMDFIACKDILSRYMVLFLAMVALSTFAATCYEQCFNYYIADIFNFPSSYSGIVKAIIGFVSLFANSFIALKLIRRTDTNKSIVYVYIFLIAMLLGVIFINEFYPFMVFNIVFFGINSVISPMLHNMIVKHESQKTAEVAGLYNSIRMLGNVFGSFFAGFIYEIGPKLSFVLSAVALGLCMLIAVVHFRVGQKQEEA